MKNMISLILALLLLSLLSACGGSTQSPSTSRTVKTLIKASALTASQNIGTIELSISLPLGVSPKAGGAGVEIINATDHAVKNVTLSDVNYTAASSATVLGQISIYAVQADGFKENDEIIIHLDVADKSDPKVSDFNLLSFKVTDKDGLMRYDRNRIDGTNTIKGDEAIDLTPTLTTTIQ